MNNDLLQFNKFAKLHNGKDIFFCKTDYLLELFSSLKNHNTPSILITGNSDYPITDELVSTAPPCIYRWFGVSVTTSNKIVTQLPHGLENTEDCILQGHGVGHFRPEKLMIAQNPPVRQSRKEVYANFSLNTHPVRQEVNRICESLPHVTTRMCSNYLEMDSKPYIQFASEVLDHKMIVCPRGNAPGDTHRFWEVLYMNRTPIIKRDKSTYIFTELPVIVLDEWEQLSDLEFLNSELERVKNNSREMLKMSYWENLILNERE